MLSKNINKIKTLSEQSIYDLEKVIEPYYSKEDMVLTSQERKIFFLATAISTHLSSVVNKSENEIDVLSDELTKLLKSS